MFKLKLDVAQEMGLGDLVAAVTKALGIQTCGQCEKRRQVMNMVKLPVPKPSFQFMPPTSWFGGGSGK